jgi:ATP-dependent RNA circularization protein (DNA/RNA ligase family)
MKNVKLYQPLYTRDIKVAITKLQEIEDVQEVSTAIFTTKEEAERFAKFVCRKGWKFEIIELEVIG